MAQPDPDPPYLPSPALVGPLAYLSPTFYVEGGLRFCPECNKLMVLQTRNGTVAAWICPACHQRATGGRLDATCPACTAILLRAQV